MAWDEYGASMEFGGALFQGISQIGAGNVAKIQGDFSSFMAQINAAKLERQAESAREAARFEASRIGRRNRAILGRKKAKIGKSGLERSGSKLLSLADDAYELAIDRALTLRSGLYEAHRLKGMATGQRIQGMMAKSAGKAAQRSSYMMAGASILGGAGRYALHTGSGGGVGQSQIPGSFGRAPQSSFRGTSSFGGL